ncbi:MAG: aminotransferase class III-fold pyridoxal phosphate-dependent enzyme, partial [Myxococcales bacterium]|nr:aminotransferase class III-fold pyridoxal phosphate-dependent enzyme [Myxococcales bacterium]
MDGQTMVELCKKHTLYAWSATGAVDPLPVVRAEGVYFWTADGKRFLDFNSQLMSVNIGHGDKRVIAAITKQLEELIFVSPVTATAVRARVGLKLAQLTPGDINTFFFTLGGAEANENAIKAARMYTGRFKILARYRSYHGASNATMMLTGDPRRHPSEPGMPGVIHVMDPEPYNFSFGKTDEEKTANNLTYLEEIIQYEGPKSIAAMFIESVTGTNGILAPPKGYLQGLRALLDKYGILLVCDEVMGGMGRTGKMYGFEHGDIIPDIVTMAKGLTSSYLPLGAMGLRDHVADHFRKNVFYGGLTYNSHPVALACAEAVLDITVEDKLVERSAQMGEVLGAHLHRMKEKHPSVLNVRNTGLFGIVELQKDKAGTPLAPYNGTHPAMAELNAYFKANGLFTFSRWNNFMTNPPLTISHE